MKKNTVTINVDNTCKLAIGEGHKNGNPTIIVGVNYFSMPEENRVEEFTFTQEVNNPSWDKDYELAVEEVSCFIESMAKLCHAYDSIGNYDKVREAANLSNMLIMLGNFYFPTITHKIVLRALLDSAVFLTDNYGKIDEIILQPYYMVEEYLEAAKKEVRKKKPFKPNSSNILWYWNYYDYGYGWDYEDDEYLS